MSFNGYQLFAVVTKGHVDIPGGPVPGKPAEEIGYVNQGGLSRKVSFCLSHQLFYHHSDKDIAHL